MKISTIAFVLGYATGVDVVDYLDLAGGEGSTTEPPNTSKSAIVVISNDPTVEPADSATFTNSPGEPQFTQPKRGSSSLELVSPIYQECLAPVSCTNKIGARCENFGEVCAQTDPLNNPCDFHCVTECPEGQTVRIVEFENRGSFRKCVPRDEIDEKEKLICSSPSNGTAQFEIQVPKIIRHKYLEDNRQYSLISKYSDDNPAIFSQSNCLQTEETDDYVIFRGPLDGSADCRINQMVDFDGNNLYDVFSAVVGYDDLFNFIGERRMTYRKGGHYKFECRVKRTGLVESFPFVDGRRPVKSLGGETETKFEMNRCTDESCETIDNNAVLDVSPDSTEDPMVWFKVAALTNERYAHLRQCSYNFEPLIQLSGERAESVYDIIYNGCSADEPFTIMQEPRYSFEFDKFGHILAMNEDIKQSKFRLSCIVDACMPPDLGVWSCDVESACAGRYDPVYQQFYDNLSQETNFTESRRRRGIESEQPKRHAEAIVEMDIIHPCALIYENQYEKVCPTKGPCWTRDICFGYLEGEEEVLEGTNIHVSDASISVMLSLPMFLLSFYLNVNSGHN